MRFKIIAKHKWVSDVVITESVERVDGMICRFTATILGYQNWKLYEGIVYDNTLLVVDLIEKTKEIRERIKNNDESVFHEKTRLPNQE